MDDPDAIALALQEMVDGPAEPEPKPEPPKPKPKAKVVQTHKLTKVVYKEIGMPGSVDHHIINEDPLPAATVKHTGDGQYKILWPVSPEKAEEQDICVAKCGVLPLLSIVYDELGRKAKKKDPNHDNTKIHTQNAIQFLKLARQKDIERWNRDNPPKEHVVDFTEETVEEPDVPDGMKPIKEMTEKQMVKELKDYGVTHIGSKQIDASHWLKSSLQSMLMLKRQELYSAAEVAAD